MIVKQLKSLIRTHSINHGVLNKREYFLILFLTVSRCNETWSIKHDRDLKASQTILSPS